MKEPCNQHSSQAEGSQEKMVASGQDWVLMMNTTTGVLIKYQTTPGIGSSHKVG